MSVNQDLFNPPGPMRSRIEVPPDRTKKQPPIAFCRNPQCLQESHHERFCFEITHAHVSCPKCGATEAPIIGLLVLTHFITKDPQGPIVGMGGIRFKLACDPKRAYLATPTNQEAASDQIIAVNCPECLKQVEKNLVDTTGNMAITLN